MGSYMAVCIYTPSVLPRVGITELSGYANECRLGQSMHLNRFENKFAHVLTRGPLECLFGVKTYYK